MGRTWNAAKKTEIDHCHFLSFWGGNCWMLNLCFTSSPLDLRYRWARSSANVSSTWWRDWFIRWVDWVGLRRGGWWVHVSTEACLASLGRCASVHPLWWGPWGTPGKGALVERGVLAVFSQGTAWAGLLPFLIIHLCWLGNWELDVYFCSKKIVWQSRMSLL